MLQLHVRRPITRDGVRQDIITHKRLGMFRPWCQQRRDQEVGDHVVPRPGRKHHGVMGSRVFHELDFCTVPDQLLSKFTGSGGVGHAVSGSMSQKQWPFTQRRNRFAWRQPGGKGRHTAHSPSAPLAASVAQNTAVIGYAQRHPPPHRVPDKANGQAAETSGDPVQCPSRIPQRGLRCTIPSTYCVANPSHRDAPAPGSRHAATKRNHAQNRWIVRSNCGEAVNRSAVQKQRHCLGVSAITVKAQVRSLVHVRQTRHQTCDLAENVASTVGARRRCVESSGTSDSR
jgi:hypothetical protein